ncbi:MAG: diguanylate cyclase [Pedobacter sp.]
MSKKSNLVRFHTRLSAFMLATFLLLGSLAGLFLDRSSHHLTRQNNRALTTRLIEKSRHLDSSLTRIGDHIRTLRATAQTQVIQTRQDHDPTASCLLTSSLQYDEKKGYFHLDRLQHPFLQEQIGSLTGSGKPTQCDSETLREMNMALGLYSSFQAAADSFIPTPWFYYISAHSFLSLYPWQPSERYHFTPALLQHPLFMAGAPTHNPSRQLYWSHTPFKKTADNPTATCAAPVYFGDRFLGVIAMDFNLRELFESAAFLEAEQGTLLLIDEQEHLLASPTPIAGNPARSLTLEQILPAGLQVDDFAAIPAGQLRNWGTYSVLRMPLQQAPWQLIFYRRNQTWMQATLQHLGVGPLLLMVELSLVVAAWMFITHIYIVRPSKIFLKFMLALSRRQPKPEIKVPRCWQPWFNTVEGIFSDNENLAEQIACQNQLLEKRVAKRTRDLGHANAALRKANHRLQTLSLMDGLTQLANYTHFEGFLQQMWGLMQRRQEPLSLILCDVDYFKQYNDTYGHQAGNQCLKAIAGVLSELAHRSSDLAARYGGEEFILLLPGLNDEKAQLFAQRIQQRIALLDIPHSASQVAPIVTVSIGIATMTPSQLSRPQQLFEQADKALYRAKSKGRNCIA